MKYFWLWLLIASCASESRQLLIVAEVLSLQESKLVETLEKGSYINVKYCQDEKIRVGLFLPAWLIANQSRWGSLENLLAKAQNETKSTYFLKASVYSEGGCMLLRGYTAKTAL